MNNLPLESSFGSNIPLITEPIGGENCTAISLIKVAFSQTKKNYDVATLWNATPHTATGANPANTIYTAIKNGLLNTVTQKFEKLWDRYFYADIGPDDSFANTMQGMQDAQSSAQVNGYWYTNWNSLIPDEVMPQGGEYISDHSFVFVDWKQVNGVTMAIIDAHQGHHNLMPREVFNAEMDKVGCTTIIPSNVTIASRRTVTLTQWINELWIRVGLLVSQRSAGSYPPVLYTAAKNALGTHQTLNDNVPADVGCAETVSAILKTAGVQVPTEGIAGTSALFAWLKTNPRFTQVASPEAGDIIISATSSMGKISHGHVGIMAMFNVQYNDDYGIISNDSDTGIVREKWSLKTWISYYQNFGGLDVGYFRLL